MVVHLDRENDIRLADHHAAAEGLVERVARREVLAAGPIEHRALQHLREFDQPVHARRRARHPVDDDERGLRRHQQLRSFAASAMAPESACGGTTLESLGMCRLSPPWIGFSCSSASSDSSTGPIGGVVAIL
jgi:hypothetical protein